MKNSRSLALAATFLLVLAGLTVGCDDKPVEPVFDNPLDPAGPAGGDPFAVTAAYVDGKVAVTWTAVELEGVAGYEVFHSLLPDRDFRLVLAVESTLTAVMIEDFSPNVENYYKVRAVDAVGNASAISGVTAARLLTPPYLQIGDTTFVHSRNAVVRVSTALGDTAEIDDGPGFDSPLVRALTAGDTLEIDWDLGDADSVGAFKHVYLRVSTAGVWSETAHDSVRVAFSPVFQLSGAPATVASRQLDLAILGEGVHQMRFAPSGEALADSAWLPGAAAYSGYSISAEPAAQEVYAELASDFGFSLLDTLTAVPDSLLSPSFILEGGSEASSDYEFSLAATAVATRMRFAESPEDLALTAWSPYSTTGSFTHGACAGDPLKIVYGQFDNDWFVSPVVTDTMLWVQPQPLQIDFDPVESVLSAAPAVLTGTAIASTCGPGLDLVEVDAGDGFAPASGLAEWSFVWDVPTVMADSTAAVSARVIAGADTAFATIDLLIVAPAAP